MHKPGRFLLALSIAAITSTSVPAQTDRGKQLYDAVLFGEVAQLNALLQTGADPNHKEHNRTLLAWAAQGENVDIVNLLLQSGADQNITDAVGQTPLMRAIETQQAEIVDALLAANPDLNKANNNGETAAMMAVVSGNPSILRSVADAGADFTVQDSYGNTALMNAISYDQENLYALIAMLGELGVNLDAGGEYTTPLVFAAEQGDVDLVNVLLKAGADPAATAGDKSPLLAASPYPEVTQLLLEAGADPNVKNRWGEPMLFAAIDNGNIDAVRLLLDSGADVNLKSDDGQTALQRADYQVRDEIVALLKSYGAIDDSADAGTGETGGSAADSPGTDSAAATIQGARSGSLASFPIVDPIEIVSEGGSTLVYFSSASIPDLVSAYDSALGDQGFEKGYEFTDNATYVSSKYTRNDSFYTFSVGQDTSTDPPRFVVNAHAHGNYSARELPRLVDSEPVYEEDHAATYVTGEDPQSAADKTYVILKSDGWEGEVRSLSDGQMQIMDLGKDNTNLSVMIQIAPAQNNRTTISYNVIQKD